MSDAPANGLSIRYTVKRLIMISVRRAVQAAGGSGEEATAATSQVWLAIGSISADGPTAEQSHILDGFAAKWWNDLQWRTGMGGVSIRQAPVPLYEPDDHEVEVYMSDPDEIGGPIWNEVPPDEGGAPVETPLQAPTAYQPFGWERPHDVVPTPPPPPVAQAKS